MQRQHMMCLIILYNEGRYAMKFSDNNNFFQSHELNRTAGDVYVGPGSQLTVFSAGLDCFEEYWQGQR
jgi:hypothetical protein